MAVWFAFYLSIRGCVRNFWYEVSCRAWWAIWFCSVMAKHDLVDLWAWYWYGGMVRMHGANKAWQYGFEGIVWRVNHQSHNRPQEANHKPTKPSPLVSSKKCTLLSCLISHKLFSPTFRLSCFQGKYGTDQDQDQGPGSRIMIKGHGQGSRVKIKD